MKNNPKISVIVPCYNAEKYLKECLDSIVNQTLKDIEVICINDGSKDNTLNILEKYAQKDNRIKVYSQENKGPGISRNLGIEVANGDFISLLDSDDIFELNMLEELYKTATERNTDILICRSIEYINNEKRLQESTWTIKDELLPTKKVFNRTDIPKYIMNFCVGWAWDKLYNTNFIKKHNLKFPSLHNAEDAAFVYPSLVLAERISILDKTLIIHRKSSNSLEMRRDESCTCFIEAARLIKNKLEHENKYNEIEQSFINEFVEHSLWQYDTLKPQNKRKIRKYLQNIIFNEFLIKNKSINYFYNKNLYFRIKNKNFKKPILSIPNPDFKFKNKTNIKLG